MNLVIDIETTATPRHLPHIRGSDVVCISTCDDDNNLNTWFFNHPNSPSVWTYTQELESLQEYINQYDRLIAHNMKFDLRWLSYIGIDTENHNLYCTLVAEYTLRHHQRMDGLSLDDLAKHYDLPTKKDKVKLYWEAGLDTTDVPPDILQTYCEQDCATAMAIFRRQTPQIVEKGYQKLISLEMASLRCYAEMESNGMRVDVDLLQQYNEEYTENLEQMDREIEDILGIHSAGSSQQISVGLFGGKYQVDGIEHYEQTLKSGIVKQKSRKCKLDIVKDGIGFDPVSADISETKVLGIYETNLPALTNLKGKTEEQKRVLELIFGRSRLSQLNSVYFEGLLSRQVDGLVYPSINQTVTKTSRLSCSNPNGQNMPRGNTGPVKECFITRYMEEREG